MSEPLIQPNPLLQLLYADQARLSQTETKEIPPLYLPWSQRTLNPFPLASSGGVWGDTPQPWTNLPLAFTVTADVLTTNNATNFWTIELLTFTAAGASSVVASVTTAALTANVPARLSDTSVTPPAATDVSYFIKLTATLSPGAIFIFPALAILRTGN